MSTLPNQARISPSWKEEVNQRIAAHKNRKSNPAPQPEADHQSPHSVNKRAAAAAARVAARFAKAPSYNEQLAEEARAAVRAAEAASRAALEAQAAAESMLAELEAAQEAETRWELHNGADRAPEQPSMGREDTVLLQAPSAGYEYERTHADLRDYEVRWESDLRLCQPAPGDVHAWRGSDPVEDAGGWCESEQQWRGDAIEVVEPAQPIPANLIEFPRELVATRKVRPRRIEGPFAALADQGAQLSIFEVDPAAVSIDPSAPTVADRTSSPSWAGPEWSGMELGALPETEYVRADQEMIVEEPQPCAPAHSAAEQAPLSLRFMAVVVDFALMLGALVALALVAGHDAKALPSLRATEVGAVAGFLVVSLLYLALFYALGNCTPGMKYAGISLCTFEGREPARAQRFSRLVALLLSVLPVGVGLMWAIFDDDHLSWHDRLSQTFLRRS